MLGKHGGPPLIVRQHTSGLRTALLIAGVLIGVLALYVTYELGRYNAGYDRQAVAQQRTELEVQIEHPRRPTARCAPGSPSSTPSAWAARASRRRWRAPWATCRRR